MLEETCRKTYPLKTQQILVSISLLGEREENNNRGMTFLGVYQVSCGQKLMKIGGNRSGALPELPLQSKKQDFS